MRLSYIAGRLVPHRDAFTHIEDRGYQFSDAVYEVVPILRGRLIDLHGHISRLWRSLSELEISFAMGRRCLALRMLDLVYRNRVWEGNIYVQVSRGIGFRAHNYAGRDWDSVLVMVTNRLSHGLDSGLPAMQRVITVSDIRWSRRDIKTVSLLPNCMAASEAHRRDAYEAWQVDSDGFITEGSHSNSWIVNSDNIVITRAASSSILNGITRLSVLRLLSEHGFKVEERAFSLEEAYAAREAFLTSSGGFVKPIGRIDDRVIGGGERGEVSPILFAHYRDYCMSDIHPSAFAPGTLPSSLAWDA